LSDRQRYVKALKLRANTDIKDIEKDLSEGNILIIRITPLLLDDAEQVRDFVRDFKDLAQREKGDIARLGRERIVLTPRGITIWRELDREAQK